MAFKILEGTVRKVHHEEDGITVVYDWGCRKPLYATNNMDDAYDKYVQLCEEGNKDNLLFIVDFQLMSLRQALRCNQKRNKSLCDSEIDDVTPYVTLGEWHRKHRNPNKWGYTNPDLHVYEGALDRKYDSPYETICYFIKRHEARPMSIVNIEYVKDGRKTFKKVRTVISSDLVDRKGYGCTRIRTEKFYPGKKVVDDEIINITL